MPHRTADGQGHPAHSLRSHAIGRVAERAAAGREIFFEKVSRRSDRAADRELGFGRRRRGRRIVSDRGASSAGGGGDPNHVPYPVPRDRPGQPRSRSGLQQLFWRCEQLPPSVVHGVPLALCGRCRAVCGPSSPALPARLWGADARAGMWASLRLVRRRRGHDVAVVGADHGRAGDIQLIDDGAVRPPLR
jgi:hypothetical protein